MIYVDHFRDYSFGKKVHPVFEAGSAHLSTDSHELDELHEFAKQLGLKRAWFQNKTVPHYDLYRETWELAVKRGAKLVSSRELIRHCHPKWRRNDL